MQDFDRKDRPYDDDEIEISDLDAPIQGKPPLLQRIVKFAETHFTAKIRATFLALVLIIGGCAFIYSFLSYLHIPILQQAKEAPTPTPSNRDTIGVDIVQSDLPPNNLSVVNGIAYIGTPDGTLSARQANDGTLLWQTKTAIPLSGPIVANNSIYIASENSQNGHIDAFRASDGNLQWSYQTHALASQPIMVRNGIIYVGTQAGLLYALRASDGKVLWHFTVGLPANQSSWRLETVLSISNNVTVIHTANQILYFLRSQDGSQLWHTTIVANTPPPDIENEIAYINNSSLQAYRLSDGKLLWHTTMANVQYTAIQHNIVAMDTGDLTVVALNAQDGRQLWQFQTQKQINTIDAQNGIVLITTVDGTVTALQDQTGSRLWQFKPPTHSDTFWLSNTNNEVLYVDPTASTITFYALQANNGHVIWHRSVPNIDQSYNPQVINDIIAVKQMDGNITIWSQHDGHPIWHTPSSEPILWNFIEERGIVYFQQQDGTIFALHVPTGATAWRYPS